MIEQLIKIANSLDSKGFSVLADELDDIIKSLAMQIDPEDMTPEELEDSAENVVMALTNHLNQAGYNITAQELFSLLDRVGLNINAISEELEKRQL